MFEVMKTQIDINCPDCHSPSFSIYGIKSYGKQNYQCKDCKRQFIGDHYKCLEVNNFWTYVYHKKRKVWLIYAYDRTIKEIVAYIWGKRDLKTAKKLRARLKQLRVSYGSISMDKWDSFITAFKPDYKRIGKQYIVGI